ncbi:hypothetical protein IWT140_00636 [Secundilactobacillus pentosiphilus]|uniref:DUF308 domain-containing protein n=1 Tax=Secundilactobacillus pentosiphilus TaxID=1714682 RepID=A0A1Z5IN21_9LACO|nr:hypothetical protein [Secundilactobacillus pentosiphilus]GAX03038.1 hypothetical protein IWT140_00636 [Secundilactobacillus pentosiphilus]GAX04961.1 hypothetical protein IWT25_00263 [Secundilactobacillus pentosiphilus]
MGIILVFIFVLMTVMGGFSWWYAAHYDGLVGTTKILTIISVVGLLFSFGYVYKNGWVKPKPTQPSSRTTNVHSNQYFAQKSSESASIAQQHKSEQNVLQQLQKSYSKNVGDVSFNQATKTYTITPTNAKYVKAVTTMWKYPKTNAKSIKTMSDNYLKMSRSIDKSLNGSYTLKVKQSKSGPVILSVKNGEATMMNEGQQK